MSLYYKHHWLAVFYTQLQFGLKLDAKAAANRLHKSVGFVYHWIKRFQETGTVDEHPWPGRPKVTSAAQDRDIIKLTITHPDMPSHIIAEKVSRKDNRVSARTVRKRVQDAGYRYGKPLKKPLLSDRHIKKRLEFANTNLDRDWTRVIFADESTFRLHCTTKRVRIKKGRPTIVRTFKQSVKVNVFDASQVVVLTS